MKLLVYSSLFPNRLEPHHGVFVKTRLLRYLERHGGSAAVVAPVPRSPPVGPARWTRYRHVPASEQIDGLSVAHPRFTSPPGFGDRWRGALMARSVRATLREHVRRFQPDVLDVHYAYPDGVAACLLRDELSDVLGRRLPLVLTCRGTDLNLIPSLPTVRPLVAEALQTADHVVCVAEALRKVALDLGAAPEQVTTLRNGVDLEHFHPGSKVAARRILGLDEGTRYVLCVGHLVERKGQHKLIRAFAREFGKAPRPTELLLVGGGDQEALRQVAREAAIDHLVRFVGPVSPRELPAWYQAADVQVLASSREGWANVVLEGLACGLPIIATRVWGTPEIINGCAAGLLVDATEDGLAGGLARMDELAPAAARPWAERFGWDETLDGMHAIFDRVAEVVTS